MRLSEYKWSGVPSLQDNADVHKTCDRLFSAVDWPRLEAYASKLRGGERCKVEELIGLGGRNLVRILTFTGGIRWLARFPLDSLDDKDDSIMLREVDCLRLVAARSSVPVPQVLGVGTSNSEIGAAFILMECLPGNVGMDINFDFVPQQFKPRFFKQMANAQVQICGLRFPRIGTLRLLQDGTVDVEPIPGIGGPFDTASAFFRAWSATAEFPYSEQKVRDSCGPFADEVWQSIVSFPSKIALLADRIAGTHEHGPFPLVHVDYGHNNIVVDPEYNILGVIDWEHAIAAPWGMVGFPLTVRVTPMPMDVPSNYNLDGSPIAEDLKAAYKDRDEYVQAVKAAETELDCLPILSDLLCDEKTQNVAAAMKLFREDGKMGFYSRVLDYFENSA